MNFLVDSLELNNMKQSQSYYQTADALAEEARKNSGADNTEENDAFVRTCARNILVVDQQC